MAVSRAVRMLTSAALAVASGLAVGGIAGVTADAGTARVVAPLPVPTPTIPAGTFSRSDQTRTCELTTAAELPDHLALAASIADAETGARLYVEEYDLPVPTASVMKLVTAVTAFEVLGPDFRFTTTVVPGEREGTVVLVGGGDPTLRSGEHNFFGGDTASLAELAKQLPDEEINAVGIDTSLYTGERWHPHWHKSDRAEGNVAPMTPLMLDGGRVHPMAEYSTRTATPETDAGEAFAQRLGTRFDADVQPRDGAEPLATVESPPVSELVEVMLLDSDNVIAETLARQVAIELGVGSDFAALQESQTTTLESLDVDTSGMVAADGSGLAFDNRASVATIDGVLQAIETHPQLQELVELLPENGRSGTLETRMPDLDAGIVTAKTGQTNRAVAIAGWVAGAGGTRLRFVGIVTAAHPGAEGIVVGRDRPVLDAVVAEAAGCGLQLATP